MANCTYTIDNNIKLEGVEGLKAWLVNGGLESLYPDGSWVQVKEPVSSNKDVTSLSLEEANNLIKQSPNNLYSTSSVEDWGTSRGQGKRMGSKKAGGVMVVGAMSNAVTGKKTYTDILGKLKESEPENYEELNGFEQYRKSDYAKARAAGFDHDYAFSYMIRDDIGNWMESAKEYKQNGGVIAKEHASTETKSQQKQQRFASFDEALNDAERELRSLAKDIEQDGDVLLGNGKFVSFGDALRIVKEGIEEGGLKPVPFQIHDRLDISMRDVDRLLAAANSVKYSKGQSSGSTVEQVKSWLPRNVRKMLDAGKLRVESLPDSKVEAYYDAANDVIVLNANGLNRDTLNSTLAHELLHRALSKDDKVKAAVDRFNKQMQDSFNRASRGLAGKAENEAYRRVMAAETPAKDRLEEYQSYLVTGYQNNPDSISGAIKKAIQDFIAAIRAFLVRSELDFGYIQSLKPGDLAALSKYGARVQFDGVFNNNEQGEKMNTAKASADIRYSVGTTVGASPKLKDSILYNLQDRFIDLKNQIEKVVKNGGTISEDSNPYMAEELYHQRTASRIKEFYDKELNPLLKKLHDSGIGLDRFQEFLHARHAPSRNAVMAERNPNQAIIDAKLKDAEESLEAVRNNPASTRKELSEALAEYNKWRRAKPFDGTEEERLSLSGMSNQEARDFLNGLTREEKAVLEPLGDMIDAINEKTLDTQIEYGMETQDSVDALKNQWKHYVPLHRDEAHEDNAFGHPIGRGFSVRGSGMKNATGSNAEVTNILAHIAAAREQMLRRGEKNKVTVALAKFIEQNPDKDFAEINKVDFDKKLNEEGLVESQMEPIFKRNQKDNVVMFRVNGKDQAIVFNEKKPETVRLAMSLKNLDGANLDAVESLIAKGTRWMASVNTQYNIIFGIVNLLRDVQGMMLNLSSTELHGKQRKVFNRLGAAMTTIYNEERGKPSRLSSLYERFNKSGGTTGYTQFFDDIRARNKSIEKEFNKLGQNQAFKIGDAALQWLRDYNTLMENATRFAVFMEAVDSGMSDAKAASLAKNITVNFNRKGAQATKVGAFYAFFNASAQGTARLVETMKGPQGKKIAGGGVLLGAITTLLGMMAMGEDEWEKIPEFVRERSIVIPTGGSNYASIPMPLGFHILPNIGRKLVESAFGSKKVTRSERFLQLVGATANAFNPLGGNDLVDTLSPTVLDPAIALMRNQDWTGRQIYREDFSGLNPTPGFTRKKDSASKASTLAAEFINKATGGTDYKQGYFSPTPDQIDYIFGQFFGGTGREALKLDTTVSSLASGEELPLHKIPLVGRLYGETKGNAVERSAYYENIKRMNEHHAEIKGLSKEPNGTMKVRQYLKENPEASLYVKAKAVQRRIDRLNDQRKILVKAGSKTSTIDNQIAAQMKVLNDAINIKVNG